MTNSQLPHDETDSAGRESDQLESREVPLQADVFGVSFKATLRPRPGEDNDPQSWTEVARRINKLLMSLCTNIFGVLTDSCKAARSLLRGLGALPGAIAERVGRAHAQADRDEEIRQLDSWDVEPQTPEEVLDAMEAIIMKLQAKGIAVALQPMPNGGWQIVAVRPELEDVARIAAERARLEVTEPSIQSAGEAGSPRT